MRGQLVRGMRQAVRSLATAAAPAILQTPDVAIIGGGPGGYVCALRAAQLGLSVVCVEKRQTLGGTCLNVGCIPSKALLHSSHVYHQAKSGEYAQVGVKMTGIEADLKTIMKQKDAAVRQLTGGVAGLFKKKGVCHVTGEAGFGKDKSEVIISTKTGTTTIKPKYTVIATGSEATPLPFLPFDEKFVVSSTGALSFSTVPAEMIVIGAGVIGLELGSVWSRLGSKVTFVEFLPNILTGADGEVAAYMKKLYEKQNLKFMLGTKAVSGGVKDGKVHLSVKPVEDKSNKETLLTADALLCSVGRRPYTKGLGLDKLGMVMERGFVKTNEVNESSVPGVFAIGDVTNGPMLAHKASEDGEKVAETIAHQIKHKRSPDAPVDAAAVPAIHKKVYDTIPAVVYTSPEVGWVGLTEEQARGKFGNDNVAVGRFPFMANGRSKACRETDGFVKVITIKESSRIVGAHIIHAQAGELLTELALAVHHGMTAHDIASTCHAHPTFSESVREAALAALGRPLHF